MSKVPELSDSEPAVEKAVAPRTVRSFVLRGRTTQAQEKALEEHWSTFGLDLKPGEYLHQMLPEGSEPIIEIGIGNGDALIAMAQRDPANLFIGVEVHRPGIGAALVEIQRRGLDNVKLICEDACELLAHSIADSSIAGVRLYFPDPWHKTRHHKRRIVQADFVNQVARVLRPGSLFHMATDWQPYAEHMLAVLEASEHFENTAGPGQPSARPPFRIQTRFERRGLKLGHHVTDLIYRRR